MTTPDPAVAISRALTDDQQQTILERFIRLNPRYHGVQVPDILDYLAESDTNLEQVERFCDEHPDLTGAEGLGVAIRALIWSGSLCTAETVTGLLDTAGLTQ